MPPNCNLTQVFLKGVILLGRNIFSPSYIYMTCKKTAWEMLEAKKHNEIPQEASI